MMLSGLLALMMALVLVFIRRSLPAHLKPGLGPLAAAPLLWCLSTLLFSLRGQLPDWISVLLANELLMTGVLVYHVGNQRLHTGRARWRRWALLIAGCTPLMAWFTWVHPSYAMRLGLFSSAMAVLCLAQLRFMAAQPHSLSQRLIVLTLGLQSLILLVRLGSVLTGHSGLGLMEPGLMQLTYLIGNAVGILMLTVGSVLAATERLRAEFEHLASHDGLTQALTRRSVLARAEEAIARGRRDGQPVSLMMIDLDHFKAINDRLGHLQGDAVLVDFVARGHALLRPGDLLGRYGGEEFLVLLPATDATRAQAVAERLRQSRPADPALPVCTMSIGLASTQGPDDSLQALLARADQALYGAKRAGRNRVQTG